MRSTRWEQIKNLFHAASPLERSQRWVVLESASADDEIRTVVTEMLEAAESGSLRVESTLLQAQSDDRIPSVRDEMCGPYRIVEHIGRGGMADVYLATPADDPGGAVAVKVLRTVTGGHDLAKRFRQEEQILARLDHPNIAKLLGGGATEEGRPYLVLEFVDGWPLLEYADEHHLGVPARLDLFAHVCDAVQFAHESHVVHRDLKPSNVLVTESGRVVLLDFGIAKLLAPLGVSDSVGWVTPAGVRLLTPAHAAPEQVTGESPTERTDVYGLGLILYELLARRPALDPHGVNWLEWERWVVEVDPPLPSAVARATSPADEAQLREELAGSLDRVVSKAIQKDPAKRFESARALADALAHHR